MEELRLFPEWPPLSLTVAEEVQLSAKRQRLPHPLLLMETVWCAPTQSTCGHSWAVWLIWGPEHRQLAHTAAARQRFVAEAGTWLREPSLTLYVVYVSQVPGIYVQSGSSPTPASSKQFKGLSGLSSSLLIPQHAHTLVSSVVELSTVHSYLMDPGTTETHS